MTRFPALRAGFLIRSVSLVALGVVLLALPPTAHAAFPGDNGKVLFSTTDSLNTVEPNGGARSQVATGVDSYTHAAWSADGAKIAFSRSNHLWVTNSDGTGAHDLGVRGTSPSWSPDGTQLAYTDCSAYVQRSLEYICLRLVKINADGTNRTALTPSQDPNYYDIDCIQNSLNCCDPYAEAKSTYNPTCHFYGDAAWSPRGDKIMFVDKHWENDGEAYTCCDADVQTVSPTGANRTTITYGVEPDWSPDGSKIAFNDWCNWVCTYEGGSSYNLGNIDTANADGTGVAFTGLGNSYDPVWSPQGNKFAFQKTGSDNHRHIFLADTNGTNVTQLTNAAIDDDSPNWQAQKPYPRPVGASPLEVTLVPAFRPCETTNADAQHGQPLAFPSCSNPTPTSSTARIGPNTLSLMRIVVCPSNSSASFCNPQAGMPKPDVRFAGSIRDIHCATTVPLGCTPGADYNPNTATGPYTDAGNGKGGAQPPCLPSASSTTACLAGADLTEVAEIPGASVAATGTPFEGRGVRITDRSNIPATVIDIGFPIPLDCIPTASSTQGSTCGVNTTANALVPGVVTNGDAAVWQLGQIELRDSGPDGVRGNSDDELFATQGVFLP